MDPLDNDQRTRALAYVRETRDLGRDGFATRYRDPFLVYGMQGETSARAVDFKTGYFPAAARRTSAATQRVPTLMALAAADPDVARGILPIVKSDRNPYRDRISVGRAASCDVVVPVPHVSKLHAHFLRSDRGGWELRDAGSTNGTFVNTRRLDAGERHALKTGDKIHFGSCEGRFVDSNGLFDLLSSPSGILLFGT